MVGIAVVTEIQSENIKALIEQYAAGANNVIGTAAAFPAMKEDYQPFAFARLW
jgi:hypothetical protein